MLQNVNSCGKVFTHSLKVTMLSDLVALKQQSLASEQEGIVLFFLEIVIILNNQSAVLFEFVTLTVTMSLH